MLISEIEKIGKTKSKLVKKSTYDKAGKKLNPFDK